jgi:hypothetical protein
MPKSFPSPISRTSGEITPLKRRASAEVAKTHSFVVTGPKWLIVIS